MLTYSAEITQGEEICFQHGTWQAVVNINLKDGLLQGCAYLTAKGRHGNLGQEVTSLRSLFPDVLSRTSCDEGAKKGEKCAQLEYTVHAGPLGSRHDCLGEPFGTMGTQDDLAVLPWLL